MSRMLFLGLQTYTKNIKTCNFGKEVLEETFENEFRKELETERISVGAEVPRWQSVWARTSAEAGDGVD